MNGTTCHGAGEWRGHIYRDTENAWLLGVCAGIADKLDGSIMVVRAIAVVSLLLFFWVTIPVYLVAAVLFREKPLTWSGPCREHDFWRRHSRQGQWSHS